jgi:predicted dehydrogenase
VNEIRIGIIGAGWWAVRNNIPVLQSVPGVKVTAVCRLGRQELGKIQDQFGIPFGTEHYQELLSHDDLDAVVISSPHHLHFEHAAASLERGLHVLCEKPMTLKAADAKRLAELARASRRHFLIPYGWNYTDLASEAADLLRAGEIGEIEHVQCHMGSACRDLFSGEEFWFSRDDPFRPERQTWSDPATGGGFAHGQLTHALALLLYITRLEAHHVCAFMSASKTGAALTNAIACRFKNGATGTLGGAGSMPARSTYQVDIRIFGTAGMLLLDIERPRLELLRHDGRNKSVSLQGQAGAYSSVTPLLTFVELVQGKAVENRSPAELGSRVVEILDAAFRSATSQRIEPVG